VLFMISLLGWCSLMWSTRSHVRTEDVSSLEIFLMRSCVVMHVEMRLKLPMSEETRDTTSGNR
jgi:hypothetical protein